MQNINKGFGLLFEMGCGKTLTAIAIAGAGYQMGKVERLLIVAPTSVVAVWPKELQEYAKFKYTCKTLLGEKKQRIKQIDDLLKFPFKALKVAVINYESTWRPEILEKLKEFDADMVIADFSEAGCLFVEDLFLEFLIDADNGIDRSDDKLVATFDDECGHELVFILSQEEVHYVIHAISEKLDNIVCEGGTPFGEDENEEGIVSLSPVNTEEELDMLLAHVLGDDGGGADD